MTVTNVEQAEDWNGASGREFIEPRAARASGSGHALGADFSGILIEPGG